MQVLCSLVCKCYVVWYASVMYGELFLVQSFCYVWISVFVLCVRTTSLNSCDLLKSVIVIDCC